MTTPTLTTITGPSGSGKTELLNILCDLHNFSKLVSVTTRAPRPGEQEGKDYYFISEDHFKDLQLDGQLVQEVKFNGVWYGTTKAELARILADGKTPAVIVEPTGVGQFENICRDNGYSLYSVFVSADLDVLVKRFLSRMVGEMITQERADYYAKRLWSLYQEHSTWRSDSSLGFSWYDLHVVNNGTLDKLHLRAQDIADTITQLSKQP